MIAHPQGAACVSVSWLSSRATPPPRCSHRWHGYARRKVTHAALPINYNPIHGAQRPHHHPSKTEPPGMGKNNGLAIGVDLGGTNIQVGVVDENDQVVAREKTKTKGELGFEGVVDRVAKTISKALNKSEYKESDITAVGVGAPGTIDFKKGIVTQAVNLRWTNVPLADALSKLLKAPVRIDNDVNVGAWGEFIAGAAKGQSDMLAVFVGTGIGGGLVLNGEIYHGAFSTAGEIGHTIIHADAPLGRRSLENCASRTSVVNRLKQLILSNHPSIVSELVDGDLDNIRSKVIAEAVKANDALTLKVVKQAAHEVGVAVASQVTMLSLPCVVLGGGLVEAVGEPFVGWVRETFDDLVSPPDLRACKILESKLGDDAGIIGAAVLARDQAG